MFEAQQSRYGEIVASSFHAPLWARNAHVQTIFPKFVLKAPNVTFERVRIDTPDDDFLDLGIAHPKNTEVQADAKRTRLEAGKDLTMMPMKAARKGVPKRIAILFHGLEGSENSHYIKHLAEALSQQNIMSVVMHFRGCSGEINRTARAYHSGETTDAMHCIDWIKASYPQAALFAVGFSLGGNMLLKLVAERGDHGLRAAVSVSAPICLSASSEAINKGFARRYQAHLLKSMQHTLSEKMATLDMGAHLKVDKSELKSLNTFRLFDEHVTAQLHGFTSADDYYARCSALPLLKHIKVPSLIIHAKDDPFMDERVIPDTSQLSHYTAYELSEFGGHVGFFYDSLLSPKLWLPQRIGAFIQEHS